MILVIDNYDSFTYNLVHYIGELGNEVIVKRNDEVSLEDIASLNPNKIVISPGPCTPNEAGISIDLIKASSVPILGVCLGHQSIGAAFGGTIIKAPEIFHGKLSEITHNNKGLFKGIDNPYSVVRYHSLIIEKDSLPDVLQITSVLKDNPDIIMAVAKDMNIKTGVVDPLGATLKPGKDLYFDLIKNMSASFKGC